MDIILLAAIARNGAIGYRGQLCWRHPLDLKCFRERTMGHPILMGRKTWESLPSSARPLAGRRNFILSRSSYHQAGAEVRDDLPALLIDLEAARTPFLFVIGGGEIYRATISMATRLELTEIAQDLPGDTFFPPLTDWEEKDRHPHPGFAFVTYERRLIHRSSP